YLHVTGFKSDPTNITAVFIHLSRPEVNTTRSKTFHDLISRCVNMDSSELFN
ncbi:hypothetical protein HK100_004211, partial [Physocladia obscura]